MSNYQRKLLVVEDHEEIGQLIEGILSEAGYQSVKWVASFQEASASLIEEVFDLAILDIMLPDGNGFDLLKEIRKFSDMPVLFLSAISDIQKQYQGFELGADDYIVKPFQAKDLTLRVASILNRTYPQIMDQVELSACFIDFSRAVVIKETEQIPLTAKEYAILRVLMDQKNRIVTFDSLMANVWGQAYDGYNNSLMAHIRKIRQKIELNPSQPDHLVTVKGLGYKLEVPNL
ncbi:response regulator transcription factor [Vaginisenegalia massiliensis]|uniref:response regulator transcription factor n=1 Tax=Vaginisenegalia massiliensis TaxID=2058294 RepID=UPI001F14CCEA|nr:response regulator transcription factor [Vaginisenegalia massiliensis]